MKMKRKLLSVVLATFCSANTCVASMPIMAGAEEVTTGLSINASDLEIEGNDSDWYFSDETEWHFEGIKFYLNGEEIEPLECTFSYNGIKNVTPADVYDGKNFNYSIDISCEYDGQTAEATIPVKIGQRGDANCDHVANIRDAATISRDLAQFYSTKKTTLTAEDGFGIFLGNVDFEYGSGKGIVKDGKETEHYGIYEFNVRDGATISKTIAQKLITEAGGKAIERDTHDYASISLGETIAMPGVTVKIPVKMTCNNNFESAAFLVEWEDSELNVSNAVGAGGNQVLSKVGVNCVSVAAYNSVAVVDGEIATIDVTIPEDAVAGTEYKLNITKIETFAEFGGEDLADTVSVSGGSISVVPKVEESYELYQGEEIEFSDDFGIFEIISINTKVATVINNTLMGISTGVAELQFMLNNMIVYNSKVTVKSPTEIKMQVGEQKSLFISDEISYPEWISSNSNIVTVEDGVLTAVSDGIAVVYAIYDRKLVYKTEITVTGGAVTTSVSDDEPVTTTSTSISISENIDIVEKIQPSTDDYNDEDMPTYALYLTNITAKPGETVSMPVRIKCDNNLESMDIIVEWEDTDLTSSTAYRGNNSIIVTSKKDSNYCTIVAYGTDVIKDGTIAVIDFTIPENVRAETTYDITISTVNAFITFEGENISSTVPVYGGSITVTEGVRNNIEITEGESVALTGDDIENYEIFSADSSIASVNNNILTGITSGLTEIYVIDEHNNVYNTTIDVSPATEFDLDIRDSKQINLPQTSVSTLKWTSSNVEVATVKDGVVYGVSRGTAIITAYDRETGEIVWEGTVNVKNGEKYGDYLYYRKVDEYVDDEQDGVYDYVEIIDCDETATSVHIPAEIEGLPVKSVNGFYECTELAEITVDEEVTCIDYSTFENTAWFKNEQAENTFVVLNNILLDASAFEGETLEIPEGIEIVAGGTFFHNETIKHVIIPETVKEVSWAFAGCGSIESVTVENPDCELYWLFSSWPVPEGFVLYGYESSTAQTYAENTQDNPDGHKITFALIEEAVTTTATTSASTTTETTITTTVSEDTTDSESTAISVSDDTTETTVSNTETTTNIETTVTTTVTGEETVPFCGDANNDGDVSVRDCATIARLLAENKKDELPACADYNGDGVISVRDAAGISRAIATATLVKTPFVPAETTPAETTSVSVNTEVTTTTETTANEGWRVAYKDVMNNITAEDFSTEASHIKYTLYDADNDSVPELIVSGVDNSGTSLLNIYSWNETEGAYKIGDTLSYKNLVPGYYTDNGELGISTFANYANYEAESFMVINIDGKTYNKESIGSTTTYHAEGMGEDTVCERGEEYFTKLETVSLDGEVSVEEYFDNWTN